MIFEDYFQPVDITKLDLSLAEMQNSYAYFQIDKHLSQVDLKKYDIALIGIPEERKTKNTGVSLAPDKVRQQFYKLNCSGKSRILDLGNLKIGESVNDTYIAVCDIVYELVQNNIIPLIIGGSNDLTYALYLALDKSDKTIKMVSINPRFDLGYKKDDFDSESYMGQIILEKGRNLFNYTNIGYQSYYCNKDEIILLNKMNFDAFRLGTVRSNLSDVEPVMRDANMVVLDIASVKQSDAPAHKFSSPNGFYSEEICQIARYAGISDNVSIFGIFELNPVYDINEQTSKLAAQVLWYFIDGVNARQKDFPMPDSQNYTKHIVSFEKSDQNIVFYQNNYNKRWWMEVPYPKLHDKNIIIACSYNDYINACNQELPERWLKTLQKLN